MILNFMTMTTLILNFTMMIKLQHDDYDDTIELYNDDYDDIIK